MEVKMSNLSRMIQKRPVAWLVMVLILFVMVATVYAVLPVISLNSPTSFPVDI
jgi:type IV secretory pathway protease TraF